MFSIFWLGLLAGTAAMLHRQPRIHALELCALLRLAGGGGSGSEIVVAGIVLRMKSCDGHMPTRGLCLAGPYAAVLCWCHPTFPPGADTTADLEMELAKFLSSAKEPTETAPLLPAYCMVYPIEPGGWCFYESLANQLRQAADAALVVDRTVVAALAQEQLEKVRERFEGEMLVDDWVPKNAPKSFLNPL